MSDQWDEYHQRVASIRQAGNRKLLALPDFFDRGYHCQENNPEGSFSIFTQGRDEAARLDEPWWAFFNEEWRLTALTSYVMDFTRARPLAMELMVKINTEQGRAFVGRISILTEILYTYLNIDPIGYRDELERGFAHLDAEIPPGPDGDRFVLNHRWMSYLRASERWEEAYDRVMLALALTEESRDHSNRSWHGAWALSVLCPICDHLGKLDELAGHAEHMADLSSKTTQLQRTAADAAIWRAVVARAKGDEKAASRFFHKGLRSLEEVDRRSSACADSMARYYELGGDFKAAVGVRDRELAEIIPKGMLHRSCQVHLERCRLLALADDLGPGDLDQARRAFSQLRLPGWFPEKLERIAAPPRDPD